MEEEKIEKNNDVKLTEEILEKLVKKVTAENLEITQNYAAAIDVGYEHFDTDVWCKILYYPSPIMPKRSLSKNLHWWIFLDMYEASLDKLTMDIKKVKIQKCNYRCGYSFIDIHSHIWQHHPELINPNTGTVSYMANSIAGVQETITNGLGSNQQEVPDPTDTRAAQPT